jgi:N-ethylmaleimide reductase
MKDLLTPVRLGRYELQNRIVMAPMTRDRAPGAMPNDLMRLYYEQRASAGLIVTEGIAPDRYGHGYVDTPGLYTAAQVAGWRKVTDAVHAKGGRIFAQLMHTGRISHPSFLDGRTPIAPSAVRPTGNAHTEEGPVDFITPRQLETEEVTAIVSGFARAAKLAVAAGFDGVEIHAANGYLPHQFLATNTNLRTDKWGGSVANRARFLLETVEAAATAIGSERVAVRISPGHGFNDIQEQDPEVIYAFVAHRLSALKLAYLHVLDCRPGFDVPALIKANYRGILMLNNGYDRERADADIGAGKADLVSFGVPFLANPDLPERLRIGAPLNEPDPSTFYSGGARGYIDYSALPKLAKAA